MFKTMAFGLVLGSAAAGISAQTVTDIQAQSGNSAYSQDSRGVIMRSPYGLCWRTDYWTPNDAVAGCDGELAPPIAKPTAPAITSTPITTAQVPATPAAPQPCDFLATLDNDEAFAFSKAVLNAAAKRRIDEEVVPKLANCAKIDMALITGHSDQLGSQQNNQKLSELRANAVASYLKSKGTMAPINVHGAGSTQPVKNCDNKLSQAKLINCLAPNRRVVIEAHGLAK
jgi:OmpA-OmpF porin, OOP family